MDTCFLFSALTSSLKGQWSMCTSESGLAPHCWEVAWEWDT